MAIRTAEAEHLSENGHQTPVLTSRWDLRDIVVAYRMFERWRQENFFKYGRQEFLIDALADYRVEPDNPDRLVPNPARKAVQTELRKAGVHMNKLKQTYGDVFLDYFEGRTPTMRAFTTADQKTSKGIQELEAKCVARLLVPDRVIA